MPGRTPKLPDVNSLPLLCGPPRLARYLLGSTFLVYFVGTALLYFFGPWHYPMALGRGRLIAFVIAAHTAFAVGYFFGVRGMPRAAGRTLPVETLVLFSVAIQLALLLPTSHFATGHWIPNPWRAASNLGAVYTDSLHRRSTGMPYVNYIRILLSPILVVAVPLAVFYWDRLHRFTKWLFAVSVIGTLALYVAMGTNSAGGEWMGLFPWLVVASHIAGVHRLDRKGWMQAAAVQCLSIVFFGVLFSASMVQRSGSFVQTGLMTGIGAKLERQPGVDAEPRRALRDGDLRDRAHAATRKAIGRELTEGEMRKLSLPQAGAHLRGTTAATESKAAPRVTAPSGSRSGLQGLAAYFSQGYFAVYLSLAEPFVPCYGVGNSVFLQRQMARLTGNQRFLECSYPVRIEKRGWSASVYWATIYPWIASDVTFPGTAAIVFLIGWLSARVWLDVLGGQNPFAVVLLAPILLMLYYFPAHNRMLQTGEGVVAVPALLLAWLLTSRRAVLPG